MKNYCILVLCIFSVSTGFSVGIPYEKYFTDQTLRVDYYHTGTKGEERFTLDKAVTEGLWPGSKTQLVENLNLGEFLVRAYDLASNELIFSRGYSTIFNEWQTTDEAAKGIYRTFSETVRMPFPKNPVQITISRRDRRMVFHELFSTTIDPSDPTQVDKSTRAWRFPVKSLMKNGEPAQKVDILILGDGYAKSDMEKFRSDAKHFNDVMFGTEPFKKRKKDFNVWTIEVESPESGINTPDKNIWKGNTLGSMYNTFGTARYVLTAENKTLRDIAGAAPYDFLCILINDTRYGGGGIYNLYATTYSNEKVKWQEWQMDYMYVHEFGHSFAGLGDEYYSSSTGYNDFYPAGVEPWEANITTLQDPANLKWKSFATDGIEHPTPWEKSTYDSLRAEWRKLDRLAADYYEKREPYYQATTTLLKNSKFAGMVGAFEGAGYASKGLYRPAVDCRMFSLSLVDFDPVCTDALERVIDFYSR